MRIGRLLGVLLNTATVLSVLMCVATVVLWVRRLGVYLSLQAWGNSNRPSICFRFGSDNHDGWMWTIQYWKLVLLTLIAPSYRLRLALRSWRRTERGGCATCGYDLRATPDRCPECGAVPTTHAARPGGAGG
jgi:hypothetical protein